MEPRKRLAVIGGNGRVSRVTGRHTNSTLEVKTVSKFKQVEDSKRAH